jgi:hypothetical protein
MANGTSWDNKALQEVVATQSLQVLSITEITSRRCTRVPVASAGCSLSPWWSPPLELPRRLDKHTRNPRRSRPMGVTGIDYTVLLAGEPAQLAEKVPQVSNLNAFPTTLFVGRDGKLKSTHAGFPSPASGNYYKQTRKYITSLVERLLDERAGAARTTGTH